MTNSNQKERFRTKIAMLEQNNQVLRNKCEEYLGELERTRKALEQSEICCTEWEKQALDYKAENIALSGDLERTRKALGVARNGLEYIFGYEGVPKYVVNHISQVLDQIKTALEQKDIK